MIVLFLAGLAATGYMYLHVPTGFVPQEDQNYFIVVVQAPPGASLSYTTEYREAGGKDSAGRSRCFRHVCGSRLFALRRQFVELRPGLCSAEADRRTRRAKDTRPATLWRASRRSCLAFRERSWWRSSRRRSTASAALADSSSSCRTWAATRCRTSTRSRTRLLPAAASATDLRGLFTSFTANDPQQLVQIDREKAKAIGVPISQVTQALGVYMGSQYVNDFDFNNRSYRVYVQADQPFRMNARDLRQYYVRSDTNGLVPLGNIVTLKETSGPQVINHFNLFRSAEIDGAAAPGYSSSQGLKAMEDLAKQNMLQGMSFSWTGLALEEVEASGKAIIIFGLGLLVVYLTLVRAV